MFVLLFALLFGHAQARPLAPVSDVSQLSFGAPAVIAEIDTSRVQGDPVGLAWNADGTIYLRVTKGPDKTRHYLIQTAPKVSVAQCDDVPAWAGAYWTWKSATAAPEDPTFKLDVEQRRERRNLVNTPSGGGLAGTASAALPPGGGEGVSQGVAAAAAMNSTLANIVTMRYKGQVVGEWTDVAPQPGMRFGWAPAPIGLLAYVDNDRRLTVLDRAGKTLRIAGASNAVLPAWSPDGQRLVFLQQKNAKTYLLMVAALR